MPTSNKKTPTREIIKSDMAMPLNVSKQKLILCNVRINGTLSTFYIVCARIRAIMLQIAFVSVLTD